MISTQIPSQSDAACCRTMKSTRIDIALVVGGVGVGVGGGGGGKEGREEREVFREEEEGVAERGDVAAFRTGK